MDASVTIDAIKEALAPVAAKIGAGATYGWDIIVRQQMVYAVQFLMVSIVMFAIATIMWKMHIALKKSFKEARSYERDRLGISMFFSFVGSASALFFSVICLSEGVGRLINPQYYAIEFFIKLVHPL